MHAAAAPASWHALPAEMKLSVVDLLDLPDLKALGLVDRASHHLCVPAVSRAVKIPDYAALQAFLATVPLSHLRHVRKLHVCTKCSEGPGLPAAVPRRTMTEAVIRLVSHCTQLEQLMLCLEGSLSKALIPHFASLEALSDLSIHHCGDAAQPLVSERFAVALAASVPRLTTLSLAHITRSAMHAPELVGAFPFVPLVAGDEDIPAHPLLGAELRLPSLLRLPALTKLRLRDTHLGDAAWAATPVRCRLEVLDLGSCAHESLEHNRACTERIMAHAGAAVGECALSTARAPGAPPLQRLRRVHLTPLFPVEHVASTLEALSGSPVERLAVQCHADDAADMCAALEDFLRVRAARGGRAFFEHLTEIAFEQVHDLADCAGGPFGGRGRGADAPAAIRVDKHAEAVAKLREFVWGLCPESQGGDAHCQGDDAHCQPEDVACTDCPVADCPVADCPVDEKSV